MIDGHLWFILSSPTASGMVAAANIQSHRPNRRTCIAGCLIVTPGDHPWVRHESCVNFHKASFYSDSQFEHYEEIGQIRKEAPASTELIGRFSVVRLPRDH